MAILHLSRKIICKNLFALKTQDLNKRWQHLLVEWYIRELCSACLFGWNDHVDDGDNYNDDNDDIEIGDD